MSDEQQCGATHGGRRPCRLPSGHEGGHHTWWNDRHLAEQGLPSECGEQWDDEGCGIGYAPLHPSWNQRRETS